MTRNDLIKYVFFLAPETVKRRNRPSAGSLTESETPTVFVGPN